MIRIKKLTKKYKNNIILNNLDLEIKECGITTIIGPSGCGKTTLLNIISGLDKDFSGEVIIGENSLKKLSDVELCNLRMKNIAYLHQFPKLLENFRVKDFLELTNFSPKFQDKNAQKILFKSMEITKCLKTEIKNLSGGEKQRVAICKAILNDYDIYIFDEPTGNLDDENSRIIMNIIKKISLTKIVILVTHDKTICSEYSDSIFDLEEKKYTRKIKTKSYKPEKEKQKIKFRLRKLFKYTFLIFKSKKWRNMFSIISITLSFVSATLIFSLSESVNSCIKSSFGQYFSQNDILIREKKANDVKISRNSLDEFQVNQIKNKYPKYISKIDYIYENNFETFFDESSLVVSFNNKYQTIQNFSARSFNEFKLLNEKDKYKYVYKKVLENDEIVLSISESKMASICLFLNIKRTYDSLYEFISNNQLNISFSATNFLWSYNNEALYRLVGFIPENVNFIYHTSDTFNIDVFETDMKLPSTLYYDNQNKPWVLKKTAILNLNGEYTDFLNLFLYDEFLSNFYVNKMSESYMPLTYTKNEIANTNKYAIYYADDSNKFKKILSAFKQKDMSDLIIGTNYGYFASEVSFANGFVSKFLFANSLNKANYIIDNFEELTDLNIIQEDESIYYGNGLSNNSKRINIETKNIKMRNNEIAISRALANNLNLKTDDELFYVCCKNENIDKDGDVIQDLVLGSLKIKSILNVDGEKIIHNSFWTYSFFRDELGFPYEKLVPNSIILKNNAEVKNTINIIENSFKDFKATCPLIEINKNIESTIAEIQLGITLFSIFSVIISSILLILILISIFNDIKRDLATLLCLGSSKKQVSLLLIFYSFILISISIIPSFLSTFFTIYLVTETVFNMRISGQLMTIFYKPIFITLLISIILILIAIILAKRKIKSLNIIKELK
ncbi:MAG: ATP-binding cassette domain-containing protein [Bacilli bacterium]